MLDQHRPLTREDLLPEGPLRRIGRQLCGHASVTSTNRFLLESAADLGDGAVAWAEFQTAGRGRLGRPWEAPRGSSILLSVLLLEPGNSPLLRLGALLAAVAACEAVEAGTDCAASVRWPNDLVCRGRKLGGVLAESCTLRAPQHGADRALVLGVGINCLQQRGHFRGELADKATSLECECAHAVSRVAIATALLARLDHWLALVAAGSDGWRQLHVAWRIRCADTGTRVTLEHDARTYTGTALEVSDEGDLIVQLDHGARRSFASATTTRVW